MKLGRNDPCPCGSGWKVKRCCGVDLFRERARVAAEAAQELFDLARHFPRYRPATAAFDRWAATAPDEPSDEAVSAGLAAIDEPERARIVEGLAEEHPEIWRSLLEDFGNDELAREIVLKGAVVAGVLQRLRLSEFGLALLEDAPDKPPAEALALVLAFGDLWSVVDSGELVEALRALPDELDDEEYELAWEAAVAGEADRRTTQWHWERLDVLLARMRERLPDDEYPVASARLLDACDQLDAEGRRRLCELLLSGSLTRVLLAA